MSEIEDFIYSFESNLREVMLFLHQLFITEFNLTGKIRFKIPFYDRNSWICYLNPTKKGLIELVFIKGNELSNHQGILSSKGRKMVAGIEFAKVSDIPLKELKEIIFEALELDKDKKFKLR